MPVESAPFRRNTISGDDARSFRRKMTYSRAAKGAPQSLANGRKLVAIFAAAGTVRIELKERKLPRDQRRRPSVLIKTLGYDAEPGAWENR